MLVTDKVQHPDSAKPDSAASCYEGKFWPAIVRISCHRKRKSREGTARLKLAEKKKKDSGVERYSRKKKREESVDNYRSLCFWSGRRGLTQAGHSPLLLWPKS